MINPKYEYLREYVERIPKDFETIGTVIHSGRNLIKMITVDGLDINVKRYTIPPLINRIAYAFFRPSKGKRAFVYPEKLLEKGFETPCPIAYIEETKMGLIGHSYFMSIQSPYRYNFCQFGNADIKSCEDVVTAFAEFTARLHEAGILHLDISHWWILTECILAKWILRKVVRILPVYGGRHPSSSCWEKSMPVREGWTKRNVCVWFCITERNSGTDIVADIRSGFSWIFNG